MQHLKIFGFVIFWAAMTASFLLTGCNSYDNLLESNNHKRKYKEAKAYYEEGDYVKAAGLFDQLKTIYKGTEKIDTVHYYFAKSKYKQTDYILAAHYFKELATSYPKSPFTERAFFYHAYSFYQSSPRPGLEQTNTRRAIDAFQEFKRTYPEHKKVPKANQYINELRNKLVKKSYQSAKLYYQLEEYKASVIALNNSLEDYPDTKYRERILYLILKSNYILAKKSVQSKREERYKRTMESYRSFIDEFPDSENAKEAKAIYKKCKNNI